MTLAQGVHPLVIVAGRLGVIFVAPMAARLIASLTLGGTRLRAFEELHPTGFGRASALPLALLGAQLGADCLDPALVGVGIATNPIARGLAACAFVALGVAPALRALRGRAQEPPFTSADHASLVVVGACTGLLAIGWGLGARSTRLEEAFYTANTLARAPLRAAIVPTDPNARLALAYRATSTNLDLAREELTLAVTLGAPPARTLEVEAEIRARVGDCAGAERAFRSALAASMPSDPNEFSRTRLELGAFHLPPSLITRCAYGANLGESNAPQAVPTQRP